MLFIAGSIMRLQKPLSLFLKSSSQASDDTLIPNQKPAAQKGARGEPMQHEQSLSSVDGGSRLAEGADVKVQFPSCPYRTGAMHQARLRILTI